MQIEGWSEKTLEELALVERGKFSARPRNDPKYFGGDMPFVQTGDITGSKTYLRNFTQTLNQDGIGVSKVFPRNTILITIAANIGDTAITEFEVACPDSVVAIRPYSDEADVYWLNKALETKKNDLDSQATQNAQKNINLQVLKPLVILTPPLKEQKKIAEILSTWDKAIETVEKLIANSQQQKKALMQQLLTGKKRLLDDNGVKFGDEWKKTNLKNLLKEEKARNRDKAITRVLSVTNHSGFVLPENQFSKRVASDEVSNYKVVKKGQFGYNPSRINVGSFARLDDFDSGILSPMYVVFEISTPKLDSNFFNFWMQSHEAKQRINNSTQGSVRDSVGFDAMASFPFKLPTIKEQEKIAQVLTLADREIDLYKEQLDKLKLEKKSLMQQLLTGQKRVKF